MSEILLVLLVALFVIKPERLPEIANALGRWVRLMQKFIATLKNNPEDLLGKYSYPQHKQLDQSSEKANDL